MAANETGRRERLRSWLRAFSRGVGWFLAVYIFCEIAGTLVRPRFGSWWLWRAAEGKPDWITEMGSPWVPWLLGAAGVLLVWGLIRPPKESLRRLATHTLLDGFGIALYVEGIYFYLLLWQGEISAEVPFPFSWIMGSAFLSQAWGSFHNPLPPAAPLPRQKRAVAGIAGFLVAGQLFLTGQFYLIGGVSDPNEDADCIVVLGAAVQPDGRPSHTLEERVRTGCELYQRQAAKALILTGGPGKREMGAEVPAMRRLAIELGVPEQAIISDPVGINTRASVLNLRRIMSERGWSKAIVVSHDYHLSRTRLAGRRAGLRLQTHPARRRWFSPRTYIRNHIRESAAWPYYYLRELWQPMGRAT